MRKVFFNALLAGAMILTGVSFSACSKDNDDLETRITAIEGYFNEAVGATVISATQAADGSWTLTMSDGKVITTPPSKSGSEVTVTENENNFIITVNGTQYVIPKAAAACQLIYSPQFEDGIEVYDGSTINVQFQMSPRLANLDNAQIDIQEAHELRTRGNSELFKVVDGASITGEMLMVPVQATGAEEGKTYAVNMVIMQNGKTYISNYFRIKVNSNNFVVESLEDYGFASSVVDAQKSEVTQSAAGTDTWHWNATIPADLVDDFNMADFFTGLPAGATFEVAGASKQLNENARNANEVLKNSLATDGSWSLAGRPGCDFEEGFMVNILVDGVVKMKVNWIFIDPLKEVSFKGGFNNLSEHMEICPEDGSGYWAPGANSWDIQKAFSAVYDGDDSQVPMQHGGSQAFLHEQWGKYSVQMKEEGDIIFHDGTRLALGDLGKKYAKYSKGVYWYLGGAAVTSSNRRNIADKPEDEAALIEKFGGNCNGEIISGWDWIPYEDWHDLIGIDITESGVMTTGQQYPGWGLRIHARAAYEYAYGQRYIGDGDGGIAFLFINRRGAAEGVIDPASR
ncbi:hypothetical protein [Xylanibacter ruminicola]|uniref:Lipoprotein n=1 Tax=Xylanibacter ruminicola TaxID=839 RepID=A0A1M6RY94_XYLRU|nr:hypothetical protein [Xylanibacter ruminicola]SHK37495.1 hypothetical protein SAMN05216463_102180 [Xylanibacter ruminicola]